MTEVMAASVHRINIKLSKHSKLGECTQVNTKSGHSCELEASKHSYLSRVEQSRRGALSSAVDDRTQRLDLVLYPQVASEINRVFVIIEPSDD
jgi:hypothetical protein